MRFDADLAAYVFLTLLALMAVADRADPPAPKGQGCRVGYVHDGDSLELICGATRETARLLDIDTPELAGRCPAEVAAAQAAKRALTALVKDAAVVEVRIEGRDRYRRPLVRLLLDGRDAAAAMIEAGQGRAYDDGRRAGWCG